MMSLFISAAADPANASGDEGGGFSGALGSIAEFISDGGVFMYLILACSVFALAIVLFKALALRQDMVIPRKLRHLLENTAGLFADGNEDQLQSALARNESALARIGRVAFGPGHRTRLEAERAVQEARAIRAQAEAAQAAAARAAAPADQP